MPSGPTFERVYAALKEQLVTGQYRPGDRLDPQAIGEELFSSVTPVRDALHRLAGERIAEAPRNDGFRVPQPTEAELREMYGWRARLLLLALKDHPPAGPAAPAPGSAGRAEIQEGPVPLPFAEIARCSGSHELRAAIANISERLGLFGNAETWLFGDRAEEYQGLGDLLEKGDRPALRHGLSAWHRLRQKNVPLLLELAIRRGRIGE